MNNHIYILSGLGADERVFNKIRLFSKNITHIKWLKPLYNESLENYTKKIMIEIKHESPIIIGLSFGGMVAIELAKYLTCKKIIIISSAKNKYEIPWYFKWLGKIGFHKLIPVTLLKSANSVSYWFFGANNKETKISLKNILMETDSIFLEWAIDKIVSWNNVYLPKNVIHIHGTKDKILPIKRIKHNIAIQNGGHLMILDKAEDLSTLLNEIIKEG